MRVGRAQRRRGRFAVVTVAGLAAAGLTVTAAAVSQARTTAPVRSAVSAAVYLPAASAKTPVRHLVVIFDENISFDHYFGTYPHATNKNGSMFRPKASTPKVINVLKGTLLSDNPNGDNPQRLSPSQALTCDQNHNYFAEQEAFDNLNMDKFVKFTDHDTCTGRPILHGATGLVMDYFDGNTVTGLWNYAQNYAMSDNNFDPQFGPSTIGALNLISGYTGGGFAVSPETGLMVPDPGSIGNPGVNGVGTVYSDLDPAFDDCSDNSHTATSPLGEMTGKNIGNLLNAAHVTWGWFQGGFAPTGKKGAFAVCGSTHENIGKIQMQDYVPHHDPFQYYKSTANPHHLAPSSEAEIGKTDRANHNYDISDFFLALKHGNVPSVSFLKAPAYEDGHAGYSDPIDEQRWLATTINQIEDSSAWPSTAIVVTYDDSDGWYDHQASPIVNGSGDASLNTTMCTSVAFSPELDSTSDRCGFGPRLPMLVISPWTKQNFVSHNQTTTDSVLSFIENNWLAGKRIDFGYDQISAPIDAQNGLLNFSVKPHDTPLIINPKTGEVVPAPVVTSLKPASGTHRGGTKVTIHGKNFTGTTAVLFGKKRGTKVKVVSSTEITVTSPSGTGTVHITVVATGGASSATSTASRYRYN